MLVAERRHVLPAWRARLQGESGQSKLKLKASARCISLAHHAEKLKGKRVTPTMYLQKEGLQDTKANRLKWMLKETLGADGAFERRREELKVLSGGRVVDGNMVVTSYLKETDPNGQQGANFIYHYIGTILMYICTWYRSVQCRYSALVEHHAQERRL